MKTGTVLLLARFFCGVVILVGLGIYLAWGIVWGISAMTRLEIFILLLGGYLYWSFSEIWQRLDALEKAIQEIGKQISARVESLESEIKILRHAAGAQPESSTSSEVKKEIERLRSQPSPGQILHKLEDEVKSGDGRR